MLPLLPAVCSRHRLSVLFAAQDSTRDETFGRRLTFFVPLSSVEGEDGGHTAFPLLGFRFPPNNGSAVIWSASTGSVRALLFPGDGRAHDVVRCCLIAGVISCLMHSMTTMIDA